MSVTSYDEEGRGLRSGRRRRLVRDLVGRRFGRLVVLRHEGYERGHATWLCACDCGGRRITSTGLLTSGRRTSCGCARGISHTRHGHARHGKSSAYWRSWCKVRGRGRCGARWRRAPFEVFLADVTGALGEIPPGHWLVRKDTRRVWRVDNICYMTPPEVHRRKRSRGKRRAARVLPRA